MIVLCLQLLISNNFKTKIYIIIINFLHKIQNFVLTQIKIIISFIRFHMNKQIEGSKPRKLIKRTNFSNPTLLSSHIMSLFDPQKNVQQIKSTMKRSNSQYSKPQKQPIQRKDRQINLNKLDSLHQAENQFMRKKLSMPYLQVESPRKLKDKDYQMEIGRNLSGLAFSRNFNYINHESIKVKQNHGYNIISCIPNGQR